MLDLDNISHNCCLWPKGVSVVQVLTFHKLLRFGWYSWPKGYCCRGYFSCYDMSIVSKINFNTSSGFKCYFLLRMTGDLFLQQLWCCTSHGMVHDRFTSLIWLLAKLRYLFHCWFMSSSHFSHICDGTYFGKYHNAPSVLSFRYINSLNHS